MWQAIGNAVLGGALSSAFNEYSAGRGEGRWRDRISHLQRLGLTPQEIMGSGVGGSGTTSGQSFGNIESLASIEAKKAAAEKDKLQRQTAIDVANINAQSQENVANIQAGTAGQRLDFDKTKLEQELKLGWKRADISQQQINLAVRKWEVEGETKSLSFVLYKTMLGMGAENIKASALINYFQQQGVDVLDPNGNISLEQLQEVLSRTAAETSKLKPFVSYIADMLQRFRSKTQPARDKRDKILGNLSGVTFGTKDKTKDKGDNVRYYNQRYK